MTGARAVATFDDVKRAARVIQAWRTGGEYMSREALASAIGVSLSTVVRWENEQTSDPRLSELLEMERVKPGLLKKLLPRDPKTGSLTDATSDPSVS